MHSAGGVIDIAGEAANGKVDVTRIDLPVIAEAEGLTASAGATVDRANGRAARPRQLAAARAVR